VNDQRLRFVDATAYCVESIANDFKYEVKQLDFATPGSAGLLDWKGRQKQWKLRNQGDELQMVSNGWDWHAYTPAGVYVDPE
jgi:hypothetical protein